DTLRRWEKKGVIAAYRSPGGHRYFLRGDLEKLFNQKYTRTTPTKKRMSAHIEPQIPKPYRQIPIEEPKEQVAIEPTILIKDPSHIQASEPKVVEKPIQEPIPKPTDTQNLPSQTDQAVATDEKKVIEEKAKQFVKDLKGPTTQKSFPIKKAINIGFIIFVVIDAILFLIYLTLDRVPLSPIL
ncbi:MAG: hypothetical protein ACC618_02245, partial [Patescibacteria group bacterium]